MMVYVYEVEMMVYIYLVEMMVYVYLVEMMYIDQFLILPMEFQMSIEDPSLLGIHFSKSLEIRLVIKCWTWLRSRHSHWVLPNKDFTHLPTYLPSTLDLHVLFLPLSLLQQYRLPVNNQMFSSAVQFVCQKCYLQLPLLPFSSSSVDLQILTG